MRVPSSVSGISTRVRSPSSDVDTRAGSEQVDDPSLLLDVGERNEVVDLEFELTRTPARVPPKHADGIDMLADGNGEFSALLGLELDASAFGMGIRSQRFALVADNGIVTHIMIEAPGEFRVSSAESVLATL